MSDSNKHPFLHASDLPPVKASAFGITLGFSQAVMIKIAPRDGESMVMTNHGIITANLQFHSTNWFHSI